MKVLIANKFYYPRGGDCIYTIELEKMLKSQNHEVAIFSMQYPENISSEYQKYFPSEINYSSKNVKNIIEVLFRPIYSKEVKGKFQRLINDFKPDVIHLNNIHSQLSPIIAKVAWGNNIPVVWTLHDYKLLCPKYDCRRDDESCELCFYDKKNVIKYRCVKGSLIGSLIAYAESIKWNKTALEKYTDVFITPSEYLKSKMILGGFSSDKIMTLNNFIDDKKCNNEFRPKEDYYCYIGRLSKEKGIETLLKAASSLPQFKLKVVGSGPLEGELRQKYTGNNICFEGFKSWNEIKEIIQKAKFSVMPSECFENNPLSVIESLCLGTPVLGANIGGIPELICQESNGLLFNSGDKVDLSIKIKELWDKSLNKKDFEKIATEASEKYSSSAYYLKLVRMYESILK